MTPPRRAPRNRTLTLSPETCAELEKTLLVPTGRLDAAEAADRLILGDVREVAPLLPERFAALPRGTQVYVFLYGLSGEDWLTEMNAVFNATLRAKASFST